LQRLSIHCETSLTTEYAASSVREGDQATADICDYTNA
jgi:hypothetical protein